MTVITGSLFPNVQVHLIYIGTLMWLTKIIVGQILNKIAQMAVVFLYVTDYKQQK
jgi:hypothetical protein